MRARLLNARFDPRESHWALRRNVGLFHTRWQDTLRHWFAGPQFHCTPWKDGTLDAPGEPQPPRRRSRLQTHRQPAGRGNLHSHFLGTLAQQKYDACLLTHFVNSCGVVSGCGSRDSDHVRTCVMRSPWARALRPALCMDALCVLSLADQVGFQLPAGTA